MSETALISGLLGTAGMRTQGRVAARVDHYEDIQ
jgi:hypothetical protein